MDDTAVRAFIVANTEIVTPPLVPEISLRLASKSVPIWQATESALEQIGVEPPYWAFCWPGGQALARFLIDAPDRVAGRSVLDFGAGCGIAAIAAARCGGVAYANEIDPLANTAVAMNAALNGVTVTTEPGDLIDSARSGWGIVLAGDICYERKFAERAIGWLRRLVRSGSDVLLADPGRAYVPSSGLDALACYEVPTSLDLEDRVSRTCIIWRVLP
ncbi:MAG: methyltransferase [Rhodospirillales bacterium]|nr:methyltransferase [Rhodospirillales bacterium]